MDGFLFNIAGRPVLHLVNNTVNYQKSNRTALLDLSKLKSRKVEFRVPFFGIYDIGLYAVSALIGGVFALSFVTRKFSFSKKKFKSYKVNFLFWKKTHKT